MHRLLLHSIRSSNHTGEFTLHSIPLTETKNAYMVGVKNKKTVWTAVIGKPIRNNRQLIHSMGKTTLRLTAIWNEIPPWTPQERNT